VRRWLRPGAGEILAVYLLLAVAALIAGWLSYSPAWADGSSIAVTVFLTWRVSRGGYIARAVLVVTGVLSGASALQSVARHWGLAAIALAVITVVQVALLLSPPVYGRTRRPGRIDVRAPNWGRLLRRPPAWLLPWGLLAGTALTLALLGHMDWVTVAGCRPTGSEGCTALTEGYPLHWLTADQNEPLIAKRSLFEDWTQWTLAGTSLLYLSWLWLTAPEVRGDQA
jgi:hypothetical protein